MLKTTELTSGAMGCALSVILLLVCTVIPSGKLAVGFMAAFIPCITYIECRSVKTAVISGITSGILAVTLLPKSGLSGAIIIAYGLCFCYYPGLKALIEKKKNLIVEWVLKELYFLLTATALNFLADAVGIHLFNIPVSMLILSAYDLLLSYVIGYYIRVISPRIQKSK